MDGDIIVQLPKVLASNIYISDTNSSFGLQICCAYSSYTRWKVHAPPTYGVDGMNMLVSTCFMRQFEGLLIRGLAQLLILYQLGRRPQVPIKQDGNQGLLQSKSDDSFKVT